MNANHWIWDRVAANYRDVEAVAPAGFEPVVEVYVDGAATPIVISKVETTRVQPWVMLHGIGENGAERGLDDWLVFVHESRVSRIEVALQRKRKTPIGFAHAELDGDIPPLVGHAA